MSPRTYVVRGLSKALFVLGLALLPGAGSAAELPTTTNKGPQVAAASNEGELAIKAFRLQEGFKVDLFAAEPHLANPVAFHIDEKGQFYVVETFRLHDGVLDIRGRRGWPNEAFNSSMSPERRAGIEDELLDGDLALRTVDDRVAYLKKYMGDKVHTLEQKSDRVKLVLDRDGDGKADHSTVYADGFNAIEDGLASGVLARNGEVWFTNIPELWKFRDTNGDGVADERKSLHRGYGVRTGFLGHDLHGLRFGPDGKLYFSVGDRGAHIVTEGRTLANEDMGAVFRCNADGSELEIYAFGLRNPQELAFDNYGNLFTGDNNSDGGDQARWVHVVEGGDSGWRIGYQFFESPSPRGPWNAEKLWHPQWDGQAAYHLPPLRNFANGPSGLAYYPGTGLPNKYANHFFLCDFKGQASVSGVYSFTMKPKGASFEMVGEEQFIWNVLVTDADFGVDGGLYLSDWVQGWGMTGKGRIYRAYAPQGTDMELVKETKKLLGEGMTKRSLNELAKLLAHADQRVRLEAQYELANRGLGSVKHLTKVAKSDRNQLARIHAIWGLGQIAHQFKSQDAALGANVILEVIPGLFNDRDLEVRTAAAKIAGDARLAPAYAGLVKLTTDESARVRFYATLGLGKLGRTEAIPAVLAVLKDNADKDPYLRHAGVMALTWIGDVPSLKAAAKDASRSVRMGSLLAMRRLQRPEIAQFLQDSDMGIVREAARAINDAPVNAGETDLASLINRTDLDEPILRRVINASFRTGTAETASGLVAFASRDGGAENMRREALAALGDWANPSGRDRVTGVWRPVVNSTRDTAVPAKALLPALSNVLKTGPETVRAQAIRTVAKLGMKEATPTLHELVADKAAPGSVRLAALRALATFQDAKLADAVQIALASDSENLRKEGSRLQALLKPSDATGQLAQTLESGTVSEKQSAFATLATVEEASADTLLGEWLDRLIAGKVAKEIQLDLVEAAAKRTAPAVKEKLLKYEATLPKEGPLVGYETVLYGGDAKVGRQIFFERAEAACLRCHRVENEGGEVGPVLSGIGKRHDRQYLVEAILFPNNAIAAGFENLLVTMKNGTFYAGLLKSENDTEIELNSPEDGIVKLKKSEIESQQKGLSGMPEGMNNILSKQDLRHLVEYLMHAE